MLADEKGVDAGVGKALHVVTAVYSTLADHEPVGRYLLSHTNRVSKINTKGF